MKKNSIKAGIGILLLALFVGCNPVKLIEKYLEQIQVIATPKILEVHGNQVSYSLKGKIPAKAFHKKALATLTPVLHYNGKTLNLEAITLKGESVEGPGRIVKLKEGGAFELTGVFAYSDDMAGNDMYMDLEISVCKAGTDKCATFKKEKVCLGIITTSKSVKNTEEVFVAGDFNPIKRSFQRSIYFLINRWEVRSSEAQGQAAEQLKAFAATKRMELQGISINSFASPDGELKLNQNLTQKRSESSYSFLTGMLKKMGISSAKDELYKKQSLEEDWNGFKTLAMASNLPDKAKLLDIINSKESNDDKETAIKALESWPTILAEMMPKLRRSDVILQGIVKNRTYEELAEAAKTSYESFTIKELLFYASESKNSANKASAYEAYIAKRPTSFIGYNNLAAVYINEGAYDKAQKALENGVANSKDNDSLQCNMGIIHRVNGDLEKAMASYDRAANAGIAVGYNKSIIHIINGAYDLAKGSAPSAKCDYNTALTALLSGSYDDAIAEINCQKTLSADDYYLKAIANARKGNVDEMAAALSLAIKENKSLASKATSDMEFYSYWERAEFKNAVN